MPMLAFFPWLKLEKQIDINDISLVPVQKSNLPEHIRLCSRVLDHYVDVNDTPVEDSIIILMKDKPPFAELSQAEIENLHAFSEIITFAGLSKREYFVGNKYWNQTDFTFNVMHFVENFEVSVVNARRRDGAKTVIDIIPNKIKRPLWTNNGGFTRIELDLALAQALLRAQADLPEEQWQMYYDSISNFNLANTDSDSISGQQEVILTAGAFQRAGELKAQDLQVAINTSGRFGCGISIAFVVLLHMERNKIQGQVYGACTSICCLVRMSFR